MLTAYDIGDDSCRVSDGWRAGLALGFRAVPGRTLLAQRRRRGPLAVQRPFYPEGGVCHVYLLHPPGGVVGGDSLQLDVDLGEGAQALLTTPGATKYYRSGGRPARQLQQLSVADGATLEWLPQENIFFPGAEVTLDTRVELHGDARCVLWEIHCLGRPVIGEAFDSGRIDSRLSLHRDGHPLLLDRLRVDRDNRRRASLLAGEAVSGMLLLSHAGEDEVAACRALLAEESEVAAAVTLIEDLLLLRYLGDSTERARRLFSAAWRRLRPMTLARAPSTPRIWAT